MNLILKFRIKVFLITGIGMAIFMVFGDVVISKNEFDWVYYLSMGLFMGLISLGFASYHINQLKRLKKAPLTAEDFKAEQKLIFSSKESIDGIIEQLKKSSYFKNMHIAKKDNLLEIKRKWKWEDIGEGSWGEIMKLSFIQQDADMNKFEFSSRPKIIANFWDFGKNMENVQRFSEIVETKD